MNDLLQQLVGMGPGIGAAAAGNGNAFASFMDGWQRAQQEDQQRKRMGQQDQRLMEQDRIAAEDRQNQMTRQQAADARLMEDRQRQQALQGLQIPGHLAELGATAEDPQGAQALIESAMPSLMKAFGQETMAMGQPAVEMAQRAITGRQKKQVEAFVDAALKTAHVADNPDADPELINLPEHIQRIVGKSAARLSELQSYAQLPVGKPAKPKSIANPTAASLAQEAAGGDPMRALELLRPPKEPSAAAQEPLMAIMGDNGEPVYVPRSQAVGKRPASTREQGRAVTSGDAGEIAEFNTALDDVATLRETLKGIKATGTSAAIGAAVPNVVTEATGWGTDAKQKNAVISRVKQVIGKALEGGVLRKEDETKYAKILPTISDPPEVVATKLDGLEKAIRQRLQNTLDALADAGYDISRFSKRGTPAPAAPPAPAGGPKVGERRRSPNGDLVEFDGKGWFVVRP